MIYIAASILITIINIIPAFMPPTWTVISYFHIRHEISLLFMAVLGAISSSTGRYILSKITYKSVPMILSKKSLCSLNYLGDVIRARPNKAMVTVFIWAISPIGSNYLFVALGMAKVNMKSAIIGFFLGRCLSYFVLAYTAKTVYTNTEDLLFSNVWSWEKILINGLGILVMLIYVTLDWETLFVKKKIEFNFRFLKILN